MEARLLAINVGSHEDCWRESSSLFLLGGGGGLSWCSLWEPKDPRNIIPALMNMSDDISIENQASKV